MNCKHELCPHGFKSRPSDWLHEQRTFKHLFPKHECLVPGDSVNKDRFCLKVSNKRFCATTTNFPISDQHAAALAAAVDWADQRDTAQYYFISIKQIEKDLVQIPWSSLYSSLYWTMHDLLPCQTAVAPAGPVVGWSVETDVGTNIRKAILFVRWGKGRGGHTLKVTRS